MDGPQTDPTGTAPRRGLVVLAEDRSPCRPDRITPRRNVEPPLRCVSSGYLSHGCSCHSSIPADVVEAAWAHERESSAAPEGFFHFAWQGGVWLAYGMHDGHVRGVYCPEHRAEREERSFTHLITHGAHGDALFTSA